MRVGTGYLNQQANQPFWFPAIMVVLSLFVLWTMSMIYPPDMPWAWWFGTICWVWNLLFDAFWLLRTIRRRRVARDMLRTLNR